MPLAIYRRHAEDCKLFGKPRRDSRTHDRNQRTGTLGDADSIDGTKARKGEGHAARDPDRSEKLPANQGTIERQECLVDVGPLVVPNAQAAKVTRPRKRTRGRPTATDPS
jgi:hypothetical protein